ncbi:MAG: sigma-70 family RNA polymerase sigma factor, partial [Halothiobacillaceae bacterium]
MSSSPTDQQLVARAREGDQRAFELLVRKYQHKVLKLIMRYVRDMDEAIDLTQETFVKAWKALGSFRGDSAFYTWIYRIAVNTAKNHLVSVQRQPYTVDLDADETDQYAAEPGLTDTDTPEGEALGSEASSALASRSPRARMTATAASFSASGAVALVRIAA